MEVFFMTLLITVPLYLLVGAVFAFTGIECFKRIKYYTDCFGFCEDQPKGGSYHVVIIS